MSDDEEHTIPDASTPLLNGISELNKQESQEEKQFIETMVEVEKSEEVRKKNQNSFFVFSTPEQDGDYVKEVNPSHVAN